MPKITVQISEDDVLDFLIRNYDETKKISKNISRFCISMLFLVLSFYYFSTEHQLKALLFLTLSACWFFILPYYLRATVISRSKNHVKNNMGMILNKPITYELKEKGVFVKYELEEATYYYEIIKDVSRVGRNVYINHKGNVPLIIPYRNNTEAIDKFIASLEEIIKVKSGNMDTEALT